MRWHMFTWRWAKWLKLLPMMFSAVRSTRSGWSGTTGDGSDQIRCSRERRLVSVRGREFQLPADERALIVLVDARAANNVTFETHEADAPTVAHVRLEPTADREEMKAQVAARGRGRRDVWNKWIAEEPRIQAFLKS